MPYRSLVGALLRSICAASLVVPQPLSAAAPPETDAIEAVEATTPTTTTEATPPVPTGELGDASHDELHDAMVRRFAERFQEGEFLFNRGQYAQAATEFERAFAAIPAEAALRNVVLSFERAGDRVSAAIAARRYLALPSCDTPEIDPALCSKQYDKLEEQLERLMAQIGELRLRVAKGVTLREISINNRKVAIVDFPVLVAPGRIDVELVGALPDQRRQRFVDVRPGEHQTIEVGPFEAPDPGDGPTRRKPDRKWMRPMFWSFLGTTAASGVALATMGALQIREERRYQRNLCDTDPASETRPCPPDDPDDPSDDDKYPHENDRLRAQYRLTTNALVGVTAGLAMVSLVVGLFAFTGEANRSKRNRGTQRASTRVRWTGAGVLVRW